MAAAVKERNDLNTSRRRGARSPGLVPREVLDILEAGNAAETANLMEQMALDMGRLLTNQFPELQAHAEEVRTGGFVSRMQAGGRVLLRRFGHDLPACVRNHPSDTVRGWGAMAIGLAPGLALDDRLRAIEPFADDNHFGVREWAWLAVRPTICEDPEGAIRLLHAWTARDSARLRRFASEATRPRGVWSRHIPLLKSHPALALPILEPLRWDRTRYVEDSVANWLNDAAKSRPNWVRDLCASWGADGPGLDRLCRRSMRSLIPREAA